MGLIKNLVNAKVSGNVGSMNFRKRGSQTVVAERSYSNSSKGAGASLLQRAHRSRLANIVNFYRVIQAIEARAWQVKPENTSDFNMLSKYNLAASPVFLTKQEALARACVIAPYEVSRGSLAPLAQSFVTAGFVVGIKLGADFDFTQNTVGAFSMEVLNNNAGWRNGDKLSIALLNHTYETITGVTVPKAYVTYVEITLDVENSKSLTEIANLQLAAPAIDAEGMMLCGFACNAAFAVHSRKVNGILETSSQTIIMKDPADAILAKYCSEGQKDAAMKSYGYQGDVLLTPGNVADIPAADVKTAAVTSVTYGGSSVANGATIEGGSQLVINGTDFTANNVQVMLNGIVYVPQEATSIVRKYTPSDAGTLTIIVNGSVYYTLICTAVESNITKIVFGSNTYTEPKSNLSMNIGSTQTLSVEGTALGELTGTGCEILNAGGSATKRTANVKLNNTSSAFTISCGGVVILSGTTYDNREAEL